jgi:hypothetical protein
MANTHVKIAEYTLPTGAAVGTFSNIPQNYTDLSIYISARGTSAAGTNALSYFFNGDTSSVYKRTTLYNDYTAIYANGDTTGYQTGFNNGLGNITSANGLTASFGSHWLYLSEYSNPGKYKVGTWQGNVEQNNSTANAGYFWNASCAYISLAPITSISFSGDSNFATGSNAILYGISKG